MNNLVSPHQGLGYLCLLIGVAALLSTPYVFVWGADDIDRRDEERHQFDYAIIPKPMRVPWLFAAIAIARKFAVGWAKFYFAIVWFALVTALIWGGIAMIRHSG